MSVPSERWEVAFVAVAAIVGEPLDAIAKALAPGALGPGGLAPGALGPGGLAPGALAPAAMAPDALAPIGREATDLVRALGAPSREARARALARAVSDVVLALDTMRYA